MINITEIVILMAVIIAQTNFANGYAVNSSDDDGKNFKSIFFAYALVFRFILECVINILVSHKLLFSLYNRHTSQMSMNK